MTPEEFEQNVVPEIIKVCVGKCICKQPALRKIMSFNFEDYDIFPIALADCEILIHCLLREPEDVYETVADEGIGQYGFRCRQCGTFLEQHYDDYSITMYRTYISWPEKDDTPGYYMVGFFGHDLSGVDKIGDFVEVEDKEAYLEKIFGIEV